MTKPVVRPGGWVKGNGSRRSQNRRALCPPLLGTPLWRSRRRRAISTSMREGSCSQSLFLSIPSDRRLSHTRQRDDP